MDQQMQKVCALGRFARMTLWALVASWVVCLGGLPLMLGIDIDLLAQSSMLYQTLYWDEYVYYTADNEEVVIDIAESAGPVLSKVLYALSAAILAIFALVVWNVDRLFRAYAGGVVFNQTNVAFFRNIGWCLIALFVASGLAETLLNEVFAQIDEMLEPLPAEAAGDSLIALMTVSMDVSLLLGGLFLVVIAKVMGLAVELQSEVDTLV